MLRIVNITLKIINILRSLIFKKKNIKNLLFFILEDEVIIFKIFEREFLKFEEKYKHYILESLQNNENF